MMKDFKTRIRSFCFFLTLSNVLWLSMSAYCLKSISIKIFFLAWFSLKQAVFIFAYFMFKYKQCRKRTDLSDVR